MTDIYVVMAAMLAFLAATLLGSALARAGFPLPSGSRIGQVDGTRGYLALAVMVHHYVVSAAYKAGLPWDQPASNLYNEFGKGAVAMFFMITGLVFYPRIIRGVRRVNWLSTYNGRFFRIVPMMFVSTMICAFIVAIERGARPGADFPVEIAFWLLGQQGPLLGVEDAKLVNAGVLWSLSWEWLFYFAMLPVFAALAPMFAPARRWVLLTLALAVILSLRIVMEGGLMIYLPMFLLGMLAAELSALPRLAAILQSRWMTVPVLIALIAAMTQYHKPYDLVPMALLAFVFTAITGGNTLFGILSTRGARVLGEVSFSVYLLHGIVLHLAFGALPVERMPMIALPLLALVVVAVSAVAFFCVERPFIALGRRAFDRWETIRQNRWPATAVREP